MELLGDTLRWPRLMSEYTKESTMLYDSSLHLLLTLKTYVVESMMLKMILLCAICDEEEIEYDDFNDLLKLQDHLFKPDSMVHRQTCGQTCKHLHLSKGVDMHLALTNEHVVSTGDIFICVETGSIHICTESLCTAGNITSIEQTRSCPISRRSYCGELVSGHNKNLPTHVYTNMVQGELGALGTEKYLGSSWQNYSISPDAVRAYPVLNKGFFDSNFRYEDATSNGKVLNSRKTLNIIPTSSPRTSEGRDGTEFASEDRNSDFDVDDLEASLSPMNLANASLALDTDAISKLVSDVRRDLMTMAERQKKYEEHNKIKSISSPPSSPERDGDGEETPDHRNHSTNDTIDTKNGPPLLPTNIINSRNRTRGICYLGDDMRSQMFQRINNMTDRDYFHLYDTMINNGVIDGVALINIPLIELYVRIFGKLPGPGTDTSESTQIDMDIHTSGGNQQTKRTNSNCSTSSDATTEFSREKSSSSHPKTSVQLTAEHIANTNSLRRTTSGIKTSSTTSENRPNPHDIGGCIGEETSDYDERSTNAPSNMEYLPRNLKRFNGIGNGLYKNPRYKRPRQNTSSTNNTDETDAGVSRRRKLCDTNRDSDTSLGRKSTTQNYITLNDATVGSAFGTNVRVGIVPPIPSSQTSSSTAATSLPTLPSSNAPSAYDPRTIYQHTYMRGDSLRESKLCAMKERLNQLLRIQRGSLMDINTNSNDRLHKFASTLAGKQLTTKNTGNDVGPDLSEILFVTSKVVESAETSSCSSSASKSTTARAASSDIPGPENSYGNDDDGFLKSKMTEHGNEILDTVENLWDWICAIYSLVVASKNGVRLTRPNFETCITAIFYMMASTNSTSVQVRIERDEISEKQLQQAALTADIECIPTSKFLRENLPSEELLKRQKTQRALTSGGQITRGKSMLRTTFNALTSTIRCLLLKDVNSEGIDQYTRRTRLVEWFKQLKTLEHIHDQKPGQCGFINFLIGKMQQRGIN